MIELIDIEKSYGGKRVLDKVSLQIPPGGVTALTGRSGSGKTTLSRILLGLESADGGRVLVAAGLKKAAVFQEDRLIEHLSAIENLRLVGAAPDDAKKHLEALGLGADAFSRADSLSGGMRRRLALARAMIAGADLIVLDEPLTGLDGETKRLAADYVGRHRGAAAVLLISHDPEDLELLGAARIFSLDRPD
jgi:NitT/TauT family transport system ATP-binding protein